MFKQVLKFIKIISSHTYEDAMQKPFSSNQSISCQNVEDQSHLRGGGGWLDREYNTQSEHSRSDRVMQYV